MTSTSIATETAGYSADAMIISALERATRGDYSPVEGAGNPVAQAVNLLFARLRTQAEASLDRVVETSIAVNETSVQGANLLYGLRRVEDYSQSIAAAAEEMAANVTEMGRGGHEIASSARAAGESVLQGRVALNTMTAEMNRVSATVGQTQTRLEEVQALAGNIATIADTIKKIATQTNLLAINAAVVAARAGDAGKGFAVVAAEVKALSERTASATVEITGIVSSLSEGMGNMMDAMRANAASVESGSAAIRDLEQAMTAIEGSIDRVVRNGEAIRAALEQQNEAAGSVAAGIGRIAAHGGKSTVALEGILATMDRAQKSLLAQTNDLAEVEVPNKYVKLAQSDHVIWKRRLANMIIGREGLRAAELSNHHQCRLGRWYDRVDDPTVTGRHAFVALEAPHRRVHEKGIRAVECYNSGDIKGALACLGEVEEASVEVLDLLRQLEIE
ncbi:MAG TPA: hypothetical protein GX405_17260 [Rhizobiales bacterium]|nr:hypothetical protein [Hyphomicrobiales bacterium]